jgi:hypothetical protein
MLHCVMMQRVRSFWPRSFWSRTISSLPTLRPKLCVLAIFSPQISMRPFAQRRE